MAKKSDMNCHARQGGLSAGGFKAHVQAVDVMGQGTHRNIIHTTFGIFADGIEGNASQIGRASCRERVCHRV